MLQSPSAPPHPNSVTSNNGVEVDNSQTKANSSAQLELQAELDRLEEMILECPRLPLVGKTLVDEDELLDVLDQVRLNLPSIFRKAEAITHHKEEIFRQAEEYAREIVEAAEKRAEEILDELGLVRRAELEVQDIRQRVQEECENLQKQTLSEIAMMRLQAQQEIEQMRQVALAEREDIQNQADEYADRVLASIEENLQGITAVVRGGREQLQEDLRDIRAKAQERPNLSNGKQPAQKAKQKKKTGELPDKSASNFK